MNIIEAIKSGKRFKRKDWYTFIDGNLEHRFTAEEIISNDWEVLSEPVTITRKQFFEAYAHAVAELPSNPTNSSVLEMMANRLGL